MADEHYYLIYLVSDLESDKPLYVGTAVSAENIDKTLIRKEFDRFCVKVTVLKAGVMTKKVLARKACAFRDSYGLVKRHQRKNAKEEKAKTRRRQASFIAHHDVGDLNGPGEWIVENGVRKLVLKSELLRR